MATGELPFVKDDLNILAMTDSGYAVISGKRTDNCIDGFYTRM
nr:hypothetical protein BSM_32680 [uncultured archaeon]